MLLKSPWVRFDRFTINYINTMIKHNQKRFCAVVVFDTHRYCVCAMFLVPLFAGKHCGATNVFMGWIK